MSKYYNIGDTVEELKAIPSERGCGSLGSSGK